MIQLLHGASLILAGVGVDALPPAPPSPLEVPLVAAAPSADEDGSVITWRWKNGLRFQTNDGRFKFKFGGRIQWDNSFISGGQGFDNAGLGTADGSEFRRARLYISGDVDNDFFFKAQYDFAGSSGTNVDFKDVYLGRKDVLGTADVKAGHFKEPFSLNELTSSKYISFLERGLPNVFAPSRNNGVAVYDTAADGMVTWAVGAFKASTSNGGFERSDGGYALTGRVTASPIHSDDGTSLLHLGVSYSMRDVAGVRYRQRPEAHNSDRFVDTGTTASEDVDLLDLEIGGVAGPVHGAAEYMMAQTNGGTDPEFSGYYAQIGWFVTGESRPYKRSAGTWSRVHPAHDYDDEGGLGAFEVLARISNLDLNDSGVNGGQLDNVSLALNWYLNPNTRVMVNYINADVDAIGESADILLLRLQFDW